MTNRTFSVIPEGREAGYPGPRGCGTFLSNTALRPARCNPWVPDKRSALSGMTGVLRDSEVIFPGSS